MYNKLFLLTLALLLSNNIHSMESYDTYHDDLLNDVIKAFNLRPIGSLKDLKDTKIGTTDNEFSNITKFSPKKKIEYQDIQKEFVPNIEKPLIIAPINKDVKKIFSIFIESRLYPIYYFSHINDPSKKILEKIDQKNSIISFNYEDFSKNMMSFTLVKSKEAQNKSKNNIIFKNSSEEDKEELLSRCSITVDNCKNNSEDGAKYLSFTFPTKNNNIYKPSDLDEIVEKFNETTEGALKYIDYKISEEKHIKELRKNNYKGFSNEFFNFNELAITF